MRNNLKSSVRLGADVERLLRRSFPGNCVSMDTDYDPDAFEELTQRLAKEVMMSCVCR